MSKKIPQTPIAAADRLIDHLLGSMLNRVPGASRICLNGFGSENGLTATRRLQYSSSNIISIKNRYASVWPPSQPLTPQEAFLPALQAGFCSVLRLSELQEGPTRDFFFALDATSALVCPAVDLAGNLVGALFMLWDGEDQPPQDEELIALMALGVRVGGQIAAVLDLCDQAPAREPFPFCS